MKLSMKEKLSYELSFAKAFKKVTGLSPSEYRKKKRIPPNTIRREDPHKDESF